MSHAPPELPLSRRDFYFDLPEDLIAQAPPAVRGGSRLLSLDGSNGARRDLQFADLPLLLNPGDLLVRNTTRVLPARLYGVKDSGGRVELMLERVLDSTRALVQLRASKATPPGRRLDFPGGASACVLARHDAFTEVEFDRPVVAYLEAFGEIPLPPYIRRAGQATDRERYQTVYSREPGAVAAPTAGLHFDQAMFDRLASLGVRTAEVTLHVGAGTFAPLREERLEGVQLHAEWVEVRQATIDAIAATQARGGRVIAIGTTVVRGRIKTR